VGTKVARWLWNGDGDLTGEDADGDGTTFDDLRAGVFLHQARIGRADPTVGSMSAGQHDDGEAYHQACRAAGELLAAHGLADRREATEAVWGGELQAVWPVILEVAKRLLEGVGITDELVRGLYEGPRHDPAV